MVGLLRNLLVGLVFFALALLSFMTGLGHPGEIVFDETHYVPAARELLSLNYNSNPEHPLFAKEMIAAGIALFGDTPFGWRFFSAFFGALSILAAFQISLHLFRSLTLASLTTWLLLTSITVTISARIAMLDSYTWPLMMISAAFLIASSGRRTPPVIVIACLVMGGAFLGLAAGSKWVAGIYAFLALMGLITARLFAVLRAGRPLYHVWLGRDFTAWPEFSLLFLSVVFGLTSLIVYFATFLPALFWQQDPLSLPGLFTFQFDMLNRQTLPLAENSYESEWWEWPLLLEPIWYHFQDAPKGGHEAILYIGNPVIFWGGLPAVIFTLVQGVRKQNGTALWLALAWLASWLIFAVLPKQIGFFYYYHGSGILLCFVIAAAMSLLPLGRGRNAIVGVFGLTATGVFLFFFPVIYATAIPTDQWTSYVWLPGWT